MADWNFAAQMVAIRTAEAAGGADRDALKAELFTEEFLIERPLLAAMRPQPGGAPVLLIDEIDRTDEPFEAFLLEALSDFQVTIPELGTIKAPEPPIVILTSNRTREVHDALKRRCLYHWVDYPDFDREMEILHARAPEATETLSREIVAFVQRLRDARTCSRSPASPKPSTGRSASGAGRRGAVARGHRRYAGRDPEIPGRHPEAGGL